MTTNRSGLPHSAAIAAFTTLFTALTFSPTAHAEGRTVTVIGECIRSVTPNRGRINLVADNTALDAKTASKEATKVYERIRQEIKKLELKDVETQTSEYSLNENREWRNNSYVSKGYRARMGLTVSTSEIARLGEVVALATKAGVRETGQIETYINTELQKETHESCLAEAVKNAREKAEKMTTVLGKNVGGPVELIENIISSGQPPHQPIMMKSMMAGAEAADAGGMVEARNTTVQVQVNAKFEIK